MSFVTPAKKQPLHAAFYSTQPFLAWCLNHYVHDKIHYVWASRYFYRYKDMSGPKSSNPYQIFSDAYCPAFDRDRTDKFLAQWRINIQSGIERKIKSSTSSHAFSHRFKRICKKVDPSFLWPIVYVISQDAAHRVSPDASDDHARLIPDLAEDEFTVVVPDHDRKSPVADDMDDFINDKFAPNDAIDKLLARSK